MKLATVLSLITAAYLLRKWLRAASLEEHVEPPRDVYVEELARFAA